MRKSRQSRVFLITEMTIILTKVWSVTD